MDGAFWSERWSEGRIGFHEGRPNAFLERHVARLGEQRRVVVPLCGKAEDLAFLAARGHAVVGVELVEAAVRAFFDEHQLTPTVMRRGDHIQYASEPPGEQVPLGYASEQVPGCAAGAITIFAGDWFTTTPELLGPIDALYDRAALIALPPELRRGYVAHLRSLVSAGSPGLVIALEYPQEQLDGPPFAVLESELRAHYTGLSVELLDEGAADVPRMREAGVTAVERCFVVGF